MYIVQEMVVDVAIVEKRLVEAEIPTKASEPEHMPSPPPPLA